MNIIIFVSSLLVLFKRGLNLKAKLRKHVLVFSGFLGITSI